MRWGPHPAIGSRGAVPLWLLLALVLAACTTRQPHPPVTPPLSYAVPPGGTFDLRQGRPVPDEALAERLRPVRLLFLGEHHSSRPSHAFQAQVLRALVADGRQVTVALEMFSPEADEALAQWRRGELDEAAFLEATDWYGSWGYPWGYYREVFSLIRAQGLPVHGVNASAATRDAVREGDAEALSPELRTLLGDLDARVAPHEAYLARALQQTGHGAHLAPDTDAFARFYRVQRMWDRLMGVRSARLAQEQGEAGIVVLLVGAGHVAHRLGVALHAAQATSLPQWSVYEDVAPAGGEAEVPLSMADWVRVYEADSTGPPLPSMAGIGLEAAEGGPRVTTVRVAADHPLSALREGDLITALNGTAPGSPTALRLRYERLDWGAPLRLTVQRDGSTETLSLTMPPDPDAT